VRTWSIRAFAPEGRPSEGQIRWGRPQVSIFPAPGSVVLHRDDTGELHGIEVYSGAGKRLGLHQIEFRRVPDEPPRMMGK
jgi:hypothetical protein